MAPKWKGTLQTAQSLNQRNIQRWLSNAVLSLREQSPDQYIALTSVCTMAGRWVRSVFTVWKRSTTPSYLILSSTMLRVMKTPVLPTPALANTHTHRQYYYTCSLNILKFKSWWEQSPKHSRSPHLQCTVIGPSCPNCSLVLCTCPMKSMKPSPVFGTPCSGQSVNWNWRIVLDWPSWGGSRYGASERSFI